MKKLIGFLLAAGGIVCVQAQTSISGTLDWEKLKIHTLITFDIKGSGITLPAGRALAEDTLFSQYFAKIEPFILSIPVDSSTTIGDWVVQGMLTPVVIDALANNAAKIPTVYSKDFNALSAQYIIDLTDVSQKLVRHSRPADIPSTFAPHESAAYTGILIIAAHKVPFHGRHTTTNIVPCLFPKIWDTEMNLIYEKNMMRPEAFSVNTMIHYTKQSSIFQNTPSGIAPELEKIIGSKPLRIIAREAFGISPTDPVIDKEDALKIISSETNKELLRTGRVAIVLPDNTLIKDINEGMIKAESKTPVGFDRR